MSESKKRKSYSAEFKAKVALEAVRGVKTINEIGQAYEVHPVMVGQWKKEMLEGASSLFEGKRGPKPQGAAQDDADLPADERINHAYAHTALKPILPLLLRGGAIGRKLGSLAAQPARPDRQTNLPPPGKTFKTSRSSAKTS